MHLNGYRSEGVTCSCDGVLPEFWCCNCHGTQIFCHECTLQNHMYHPLYRIKMWNRYFFQCITLKKLRVQIQLGHNLGERYYNPHPSAGDDFVVIGLNGVHEVVLDFCGCTSAQVQYKQLLYMWWYLATHFHILSFENKVSAYEFYHSLARYTNNSRLIGIKDRYSAFMWMVCQWHNLKQLGHGGRGHDSAGVDATAEGEWKNALFVTIDANFRLKRKVVSSDTAGPSLNAGWMYFMQEGRYKSYIADRATENQERSTCISHNVVNMADIKSSHGPRCHRHDMKLPNGVGDLQKEEQYINMDYIMCSALLIFAMSMINISYDIICQWHKRLWTWMETMPEWLCPPHESFLIQFLCHNSTFKPMSISVARTSLLTGQDTWAEQTVKLPERGCTKEMRLGTCQDTLDDHFKIESWEEDNFSPNSFESQFNHKWSWCFHTIQLQLIELETQKLQAGIDDSLYTNISPSRLIILGINFEDQEAHLRSSLANVSLNDTNKQKATMQTQITSLQQWLYAWARIQELYMPVVSSGKLQELKPEDFNLWLPSHLPADTPVDKKLAGHEWELCYAQALDALNQDKNVCGQASSTHTKRIIDAVESRKQASVLKYKCARNTLLSLGYCNIGHQLEKCSWEATILPLLDSDIKLMGDMEQQGRETISWIWLDSHAEYSCTENECMQDCVCLEWCKACAHAHQWSEGVELLLEEMR
ncbi:hypothetical protein DFJ58DRAFT_714137 [Suillus subalutaceus]|uniref:uncharacterized protein n=1 Tax=Suillus subalutaceus TaxID=48586 RepID=UPI001B87B355|nr:uncharacterized protein DFJ58DRAFT_714137 [Suillus subalutaceus]KAG1868964.1 hypothetical protein DFJ58DRAFT_714137 [Suillus subalutaceus]